MFSLQALGKHLKDMRGYMMFGVILFFAGMVVGGTNVDLHGAMNEQLKGLGDVAGRIESSAHPVLYMFLFIFFNNAIKSILVMYLGVLFGIIPIFFLVFNGMVLGYLFTELSQQQGAGVLLETIARGILPHGIIEIPAIILACAYGIKFGTLTLRGAGSIFKKRTGSGGEFERFAVRTVPVMVLLTVLLLAAAAIESTVTLWLMDGV